ncbi:unnamed protein product [Triticum turgidum subsp. durum]|uniref:Uncharacterized protein n=1 Tax=Triticum turgidum subsp. durum TaxID=4567 RepID=A0A9R0QBH3_TRITD|nr:unnamed protein product [Triticum turgidum subsp. durum]
MNFTCGPFIVCVIGILLHYSYRKILHPSQNTKLSHLFWDGSRAETDIQNCRFCESVVMFVIIYCF